MTAPTAFTHAEADTIGAALRDADLLSFGRVELERLPQGLLVGCYGVPSTLAKLAIDAVARNRGLTVGQTMANGFSVAALLVR